MPNVCRIHPSVVLTAAHCVHKKVTSELKIRAGEWNCKTKYEIYAHEDRYIASVQIHEHFDDGALHNDVALLFLAGAPLELAPNINTVCLPPMRPKINSQECFVSGWGKDIFGKTGRYQMISKKLKLSMISGILCEKNLRKTRLGDRFKLHSSFLCAGGEKGKDACKGDGGGPLMCRIKNGTQERYYQTGVVAWVSVSFDALFEAKFSLNCGFPGHGMRRGKYSRCVRQSFELSALDRSTI
jgi:plasma kallikrein